MATSVHGVLFMAECKELNKLNNDLLTFNMKDV